MTEEKSENPVLSRMEVMRGLRISSAEGMYATAWTVLTTGAFQIGFARYLGANDFVLGLLAGLPTVVGLLQIPAALYSDGLASRKRFVAANATAGRLIWLLILGIPFFFFLPAEARIWAFVVLLTLSSALLTIVTPAWTSWMSDLVPTDFRGRYFGQRNMLSGIVTMLLPIPAGAFLDLAVKRHWFAPSIGFAVLFAIACAASVLSFVMLLRQPEPPRSAPPMERVNPFKALSAPLANKNFRAFVIYSAAIVVSQTLPGQFFTAWQLDGKGLHLPYFTVQILGAVASGAGLATTQIWGYLSDKFGSRPLLQLATAITVIAPFIWLFTVPGAFTLNVVLIVALNILSGIAWAGVGLAQFNLLLSTAPAESRSTYVAVFSAITGVIGGIAPIVGGLMMEALRPFLLPLGIVTLNNYKVIFIIAALIRFLCIYLLSRVKEADGRSTRYVLEQLTASRPASAFLQLRRLSRPAGEVERERAIEQLAELRSPLAVEELVVALDDVSQLVRESAVHALGEIRDARAVPALSEKLTDPVAGIGTLAADALGQIGDASATPALNAAACGEDAEVTVAALKAIARIADPLSLPVIIGALDARHPTACEAACTAVSAIAPKLPVPDVRALIRDYLIPLLDSTAPRGVRFAAARALRDAAKNGATAEAAITLLSRLNSEPDPAVASRLAFALARFGSDSSGSDFGALHETRTVSLLATLDRRDLTGLAYKQTLAAVAEMGLAEEAFYPYLGLNEMARDEATARLTEEIRHGLQKAAAESDIPTAQSALEAYTTGEYIASVRDLGRMTALHTAPTGEPARRAAAVLGALARRRRPDNDNTHPEEVLLAMLLARTALAS